jgi:hypothetical protein
MAENIPQVEPKAGVTPVQNAAETPAAGLSDDLLRIPAIQGLLAGSPPAVSASLADFAQRPEGQLIAANKDPLMAAGMGLYRSVGGDIGVIFNQGFVSGAEIQEADKNGTLAQLAPSFDEVNQQIASSGDKNPVLNPGLKPPTGFKSPPPPSPGPAPAISPAAASSAPAPTSPRLVAGKARNALPGSPTSGPKPGAGRLMNQILKPVI